MRGQHAAVAGQPDVVGARRLAGASRARQPRPEVQLLAVAFDRALGRQDGPARLRRALDEPGRHRLDDVMRRLEPGQLQRRRAGRRRRCESAGTPSSCACRAAPPAPIWWACSMSGSIGSLRSPGSCTSRQSSRYSSAKRSGSCAAPPLRTGAGTKPARSPTRPWARRAAGVAQCAGRRTVAVRAGGLPVHGLGRHLLRAARALLRGSLRSVSLASRASISGAFSRARQPPRVGVAAVHRFERGARAVVSLEAACVWLSGRIDSGLARQRRGCWPALMRPGWRTTAASARHQPELATAAGATPGPTCGFDLSLPIKRFPVAGWEALARHLAGADSMFGHQPR